MNRFHLLLILLIGVFPACETPTEPHDNSDLERAVSYEPFSIYRVWWNEVEECMGVEGDFDKIKFFKVPGETFSVEGKDNVLGYWKPPHSIYVAGYSTLNEIVIKHEMGHELLRPGTVSQDHLFVECTGAGHGDNGNTL